ncbi:hypothetical protein CL633_03150 [bacterium]|nr:hypothetical protein [bacterium]|tara:strand:+ start:3616 stop:4080 length:465 start_codon:yes stop_codon:yes gene_type:complete
MKVLVVEDRFDNAVVALQFFKEKGIEAEVIGTANNAKKKLEKEAYLGAIIDVEIPQAIGETPQVLGPGVGELAKELGTPHVYLTGGYFHHGPQAKVFVDEFCLEQDEGNMVPDKTDLGAWEAAWDVLRSLGNLEEIYESRVRYQKFTGEMYRRA